MRASVPRHKAMVEVLGVSMLERNLLMLVCHGFRDIVVAISAGEPELIDFARRQAARFSRACGVKLKIFVERWPLGTIGAARLIGKEGDHVLVVNVDNLTSLDLAALISRHRRSRAAMTIATHCEPFAVPFGQVSIRRGVITDYKEKPVLPVALSSGTYVLGPAARGSIPSGRAVGAPELVHILLRAKQKVAAFPHSTPWIDVNDSALIERAEALVAAHFCDFELWREPAPRQLVVLGVRKDLRIAALASKNDRATTASHLPSDEMPRGADNVLETAAHLSKKLGLQLNTTQLLTSFDELNWETGQRTRQHLIVGELKATKSSRILPDSLQWLEVNDLSISHSDSRTLAYLQRYVTSSGPHSFSN